MVAPDKPTIPARSCEKCKAEMTQLNDLPSLLGRSAISLLRLRQRGFGKLGGRLVN
jgi:hypothetical protein